MAVVKVKILAGVGPADLKTKIDAFVAGAGALLADGQRAGAMSAFRRRSSGKTQIAVALSYDGEDTPASGAKTADLQYLCVQDDKVDRLQAAVDETLALAVHSSHSDGVTTAPGVLTSAGSAFVVGDVGRLIQVGDVRKAITVRNSATSVDYDTTDGSFASGTGVNFSLLGAESIQDLELATFKDETDGDTHMVVMMAVEGEAA